MEEFDSNYLAWILYKLFYGIDKEVAKNKERSYVEIDLSNNCKYDVFYNYVKILNLMTLLPVGAVLPAGTKRRANA